MTNLITLTSSALTAQINPHGAELHSLKTLDGKELMTDADPAFWSGRAPLLFPIVGALNHDRYRLSDTEYALEKHGFARRSPFVVREHSADAAALTLCANDRTRALYPFAFKLRMAFALTGSSLQMTAEISNRGDVPMPFSFGYHPAFAWPLPFGGAKEDHQIVFEHAEPADIRRIVPESGLVLAERFASPVGDNAFAPTHDMFAPDAMIWDQMESRSLHWGVPGKPRLKIDFPDTPWLGLWQKPGARYLCIEPWAGMADPVDFAGDFAEKPGVMTLQPQEMRSFRLNVTLMDN
jgi:galactose mutarotase-like enzyme